MKIIVVDDERLAVDGTLMALDEMPYDIEKNGFTDPSEALDSFRRNPSDIAFLDIRMGRENGLTLAKKMKDIHPEVRIIFLTGYSQYAADAYQMHASGYIIKPVTVDKIRIEIDALLHPPVPLAGLAVKRIRIQCFGNFEVFIDGVPVRFPRSKSKELLAFLVDRKGSAVTMAEIASILWDDGRYDASRNSQIHNFLTDLIKAFNHANENEVIFRTRNSISVNTEAFDCDYYSCISGNPVAINSYYGEYMSQYSWAEFTTGELTKKYS